MDKIPMVTCGAKITVNSPLDPPTSPIHPSVTSLLLIKSIQGTELPEIDFEKDLNSTFIPINEAWFEPGILGVAMIGDWCIITLLMSLGSMMPPSTLQYSNR
jgi:hypothetical protein